MEDVRTEYNDLNLHATLCAERYRGITQEFNRVMDRMDKIEGKVDEVKKDVGEGQKSMKTTIIGAAATIVSGLLALALAIYLN